MQLLSKPLLLKAGPIILAAVVGATAMYAWQALAYKAEPRIAAGSMSAIIEQLHKSPHADTLPVQVIDEYN
jgi:hypothetical protein